MMTQVVHKGKTVVDAGSYYAPYIPQMFQDMKLRIISGPIKLSEGQTAYELSKFPNDQEMAAIRNWAVFCEVDKYVLLKTYYKPSMMDGASLAHAPAHWVRAQRHCPAIQLAKGTPERVHTLTLLRWS